ncbi:MAG: aminotransferase class V-fold PLP-dependent enzyme [Acetobacteraceae bacterium]|nr:aminotransferase class V-fold PLP-dependent enzyme [Acetobacteraceae bacterium]
MSRELPGALRDAAYQLAAFVGVEVDDLVFVENATTGCNAVLRSLRLGPGDEILTLAHGYGAVRNAARFVAERAGATVVEVPLPFPRPAADELTACVRGALTERTRVAVIDHVTSPSALVLPVADIAAACKREGVPVLIDGAHGPGQIPLDLPATGADWYAGNCHKWLCAPKGCGLLWAAPERQAALHPVTISHGLGRGFVEEFDWTGTRDPSAFLAVEAAIDFIENLGGPALMARNADLARRAALFLADRLGTETGAGAGMGAAMGLVRLPLRGPATPERAERLRERLLDARADAPVHVIGGAAWLRLSAHAYNEMRDYERLAELLAGILATAPNAEAGA